MTFVKKKQQKKLLITPPPHQHYSIPTTKRHHDPLFPFFSQPDMEDKNHRQTPFQPKKLLQKTDADGKKKFFFSTFNEGHQVHDKI